jgi:hypothetical protein
VEVGAVSGRRNGYRFYSFISIIMIRGGNDRREARSEGERVYETTSESGVRGEPSIG